MSNTPPYNEKIIFSAFVLFLLPAILLPVSLAGSDRPALRVGVASMITPVSAVRYYQQMVDYLADKMGMKGISPLLDFLSEEAGYTFELLLKNTYQEAVNSLGNGETHFALLGPPDLS